MLPQFPAQTVQRHFHRFRPHIQAFGGLGNQILDSSPDANIGGGTGNVINSGDSYATIDGGTGNTIDAESSYSSIGGGGGNTVGQGNSASAIAGGSGNQIGPDVYNGFIGGGYQNTVTGTMSTVSGGQGNYVSDGAQFATIAGGGANTATHQSAVVCGGENNTADGLFAVVAGGNYNYATNYSFAAGYNAQANTTGSFVWADQGSLQPFYPYNNNTFNVRCTGGVIIVTAVDGAGRWTAGSYMDPGDGSWSSIPNPDLKTAKPVNPKDILEKLAALPVVTYHKKGDPTGAAPDIGPMARDFKAAFYPGRDDKSISTLEFDGVELAAIQGLNQKLEAQQEELKKRDAAIQSLQERLDRLEKRLPGGP